MEIIIIFLIIFINGFFALSEIAFVTSSRDSIERSKAQGNARADLVLQMMDQPDIFLSSIQVGITLVGIISGAFGVLALAHDFADILSKIPYISIYAHQMSVVLIITAITYFSIVLGELVPKTIALKDPEKIILFVIPAINAFSFVAMPLVTFLSISTKAILKILRIKLATVDPEEDPIKEILGIAKVAAIKNRIDKEQEKIIENTMKIRKINVGAIMIKKEDMKILKSGMSLNEALIESHIHHHTRFPLIDNGNSGKILGYVNFKDIINMLRINPGSSTLIGICRPIVSVQETEIVTTVLRTLIREHQHIAIVKNKDITVGLITLEDILETIVGDISDEYDIMPEYLYNITTNRFMSGGGVKMSRLREVVSSDLPDDGRTLTEWLSETLKQPIKVEKTFKYGNVNIFVRKMRRSKVYEAIIENCSVK